MDDILKRLRRSTHKRDQQAAAEIERLRAALREVAALARFELDHPTDLRDTAFSLIEKAARKATHET